MDPGVTIISISDKRTKLIWNETLSKLHKKQINDSLFNKQY